MHVTPTATRLENVDIGVPGRGFSTASNMRRMSRLVILCVLIGCSSKKPENQGSSSDPCSPAALNLPKAKPLVAWQPPEGCTVHDSSIPKIMRTPEDSKTRFECKGALFGFDFSSRGLLVAERTLSPGTTGVDVLDDGKTVTFVSKMQTPCPNETPPKPTPISLVYAISAGDRAFAEASCTVERKCP